MNSNKLQEANLARAKRKAKGLLVTKSPLERALDKPNSMRAAINAKCYDCMGRDYDPKWRARIRDCWDTECPLHNLRPFTNPRSGKTEERK